MEDLVGLSALFDHFDSYTKLPISVNDIRDQIVGCGYQDKIQFHKVKIDSSKLRGFLHRYTTHNAVYSEPNLVSDVYYADDLEPEWARLVCAKELVHIVEPSAIAAYTRDQVDALIDSIVVPFDLKKETAESISDRIGIISALGLLFPRSCRDLFRPKFSDGTVSEEELSLFSGIPSRYIEFIMRTEFDDFIATILEDPNHGA